MSGCFVCGVPVSSIYNDERIAPEEVNTVHKILDLFKPDSKLDVDYETMWSESKEEYVTRLTGLEINIDYKILIPIYEYFLTSDKI